METQLIIPAICAFIIILACALYLIRRIIGKDPDECDHRFTLDQVQDLNQDPQCEYCKKYLSAIDPDQLLRFEWNEESSKYQLVKSKHRIRS